MCGIVARLGEHDVRPALKALAHRGVRLRVKDGSWGGVGHVRLPIVGLDPEYDQPVEFGSWVLAFVGEILDFRDKDPGAQSDLTTLIDIWQRSPLELTGHDGFWAVVAVDKRAGQLHVLCDYLAQKPMYYRDDLCAVASELTPLVQMGMTTLDRLYLADVMKWGYCPDPQRTPYDQIKRVRPGEHVILSEQKTAYTELIDPLLPERMMPSMIKNEIEEAVRRRVLSADVPVAALVSGGLDSAITYTLARRYGDVRPLHIENGEKAAARAVVGDGILMDYLEGSDDVSIERALQYMQEPIDLGSLAPQVALSDALEGLANVCLTGDGADELFGGYGRASRYDSQMSDVWRELVCWHLPRLDRVMMRNRVEVRSPFLARRVAAGALALPWEMRKDKKVLRNLFRADLPKGVADTPKKPLRPRSIEEDRESRSWVLVEALKAQHHKEQLRWMQ